MAKHRLWVRKFVFLSWLWPRLCMYPWASSLTSLVLNLFCSKLGGKWYSLSCEGVMRVPSGTFRWNRMLQKSRSYYLLTYSCLLTIIGNKIRGLTICQGRCIKSQFEDLTECSILTIKTFINEFQIGKDSFSPLIHLPF